MAAVRYRRAEWRRAFKELPPELKECCGVQDAPPSFVLVTFDDDAAREWIERRIAPVPDPEPGTDLKAIRRPWREQA